MIITQVNPVIRDDEQEVDLVTTGTHQYRLVYKPHMHGGGVDFMNCFSTYINAKYPGRQFTNCLEWCAGPGFIAHHLLDLEICQNIYLMDHYQPLESYWALNKSANSLSDRVKTQIADKISDIPSTEKFDLVVSNPPHFKSFNSYNTSMMGPEDWYDGNCERLCVDQDWLTHLEFFNSIGNYLNPNAVILLVEHTANVPDLVPLMEGKFTALQDHFSESYDKLLFLNLTKI